MLLNAATLPQSNTHVCLQSIDRMVLIIYDEHDCIHVSEAVELFEAQNNVFVELQCKSMELLTPKSLDWCLISGCDIAVRERG